MLPLTSVLSVERVILGGRAEFSRKKVSHGELGETEPESHGADDRRVWHCGILVGFEYAFSGIFNDNIRLRMVFVLIKMGM